jgi:hypothetical protein
MIESQNTLKKDITFTLVYNTVNTFFGIKTEPLELKYPTETLHRQNSNFFVQWMK